MLNEKQINLIEYLVEGEMTVQECLDKAGVAKSTYYDWRKGNKEFMKAYEDAVEEKVRAAKLNIRRNVEMYLNRLDRLSLTGKNEAARVNAIAKLLTIGELDPQFKQEVTIKNDDTESKNYLMEMLKKQEEED